jgi:hypothetical protein
LQWTGGVDAMMDIISRGMAAVAITNVQVLNNYVTNQLVKIDLIRIVTELPVEGEGNKIYLVPKNVGETSEKDYYDEYIWVNKGTEDNPDFQWEFVASRPYNVDLSNYATKEFVETEISKNDIARVEYEITTSSATYEVDGEVINIEMVDTITSEIVLGNVRTKFNDGKTNINISFSAVPTNPVKIVIFSTK